MTELKYFKVTGSLHQMVLDWIAGPLADYSRRMKAFLAKVGTEDYLYVSHPVRSHCIVGFRAGDTPVPGTKRNKNHPDFLVPDRRTSAGKALMKELESLRKPLPTDFENAIAYPGCWILGNRMYGYGLKSVGDFYLFSMPEEIPDLEHPELVKLKTWEALKLLDEYKTSKDTETLTSS